MISIPVFDKRGDLIFSIQVDRREIIEKLIAQRFTLSRAEIHTDLPADPGGQPVRRLEINGEWVDVEVKK